ncbi:MAG: HAD-IIB family hydrolase [Candidatus Aminicenantes bacterium]|nr:HAD-IIB family hydrolase [Candidatus Aminicenantes bacterium]
MIDYGYEKDCHFLVFTDLDGTLLDYETYSFKRALPVIRILKEKNIPLIFSTSKTRAETEEVKLQLKNTHPFISENGGAIFVPKAYFSLKFNFTREDSDYLIIELGTPYTKLREAFKEISSLFPGKLKGFGDFSSREVADLCGFSSDQAELAKQREYDEPFILEDGESEAEIQRIVGRLNLQITRGGRFYHLTGQNDKGKAVLILKNIYEDICMGKSENLKTIALGDSFNDKSMLEVVDYPILVKKPDGSYDPTIKLDNMILASGAGPTGWSDALLKLLDKLW